MDNTTLLLKYERTIREWPLINSGWFVFTIGLFYLTFVTVVGPEFMSLRKAMKLKFPMMIYNFVQVFLSAYMVYWSLDAVPIFFTMKSGYDYFFNETDYWKHFGWLYFVAKISELFDTVFMVLRKKEKQITVLHVYHHTSILFVIWGLMKYFPGDHICILVFINSLVHVFMYSYYFLASFGPSIQKYLILKKYITLFQLIQFITGIIYWTVAAFRTEFCKIPGLFLATYFALFFKLFLNFYKKSYNNNQKNNPKLNYNN